MCQVSPSYLSVVIVRVVVALVPQMVRGVPVASVPGVAGVVVTIVPGPAIHPRPLHPLSHYRPLSLSL